MDTEDYSFLSSHTVFGARFLPVQIWEPEIYIKSAIDKDVLSWGFAFG